MLGINRTLKEMGFTAWSTARPPKHTEVVLSFQTREIDSSSYMGIDFVRGWYSTWIKGPSTEGCGISRQWVLDVDPEAAQTWVEQEVFIIHSKIFMKEAIRPGIIPAAVFTDALWAPVDLVVKTGCPPKGQTISSMLNLKRDVCKTRIKHRGIMYPLVNI